MSFDITPSAVDADVLEERMKYLDNLEAQLSASVQWKECSSPAEYRRMRREGLNGFQVPVSNPMARTITITGREGHSIELRIIGPESGVNKGVWLHFHAGEVSNGTIQFNND